MRTTYFAMGVLVLGLAGLWYVGGGSTPPSLLARDGLDVAPPVSHANLTVFFLHGADQVDDQRVMTLQEALENGWAVIHETGTVSELAVENLMETHDLFLQSGDIIKGGRQDRMIASDMLVPAGSGKLPLPSHCVEQGRWAGRGNEKATHFSKSDNIAVGNALKIANLSRNQSEVWRNISVNQMALASNVGTQVAAVASPTSLQLSLENEAVQRSAGDYEHALRRSGEDAKGIVGVVFVINGQVTNAEVYGSNGLFKRVWPRLLKSASIEAVATKPTVANEKRVLTTDDVEAFLLAANRKEAFVQASGRAGRQNERLVLSGLNHAENVAVSLTNEDLSLDSELQPGLIVELIEEPIRPRSLEKVTLQGNAGTLEPSPAPGLTSVAQIDNHYTLQTETRVPGKGNAVLHRSILKK